MQAVRFGHRSIRPARDLVFGERVLHFHQFRDALSRGQPHDHAAAQVAEREISATARKRMELRHEERIDLACRVEEEAGRRRRLEIVEAAPVDDPVARQCRDRSRPRKRVRRKIADDAAGQSREVEQQSQRGRNAAGGREDAVVSVNLANHAVAQPIRGHRELDGHVRELLEAIELAAVLQDARDDAGLGDSLDEIVEHHPLVMPRHDPARLEEEIGRRRRRVPPACRRPCCGTSETRDASARRPGSRRSCGLR